MNIETEVLIGGFGSLSGGILAVWMFMKTRLDKKEDQLDAAREENSNLRESNARLETELKMMEKGISYKRHATNPERIKKIERMLAEAKAYEEQNG